MTTVIKAGKTGTLLGRLSTVDLSDHQAEASNVLDAARRKAEQIVIDAQQVAERIRSEARQCSYDDACREGLKTGRVEGYEAARNEAMQQFSDEQADLVADMRRVVDEVDAVKNELRLSAQQHFLDFAIALARKLTFAIGDLSRDAAVANLDRALSLIGSKTDLTVRAHSQDIDALRAFAASLSERIERADGLKLVSDDSLAPGGCVVRNEQTEVDASLETQLSELVTLLTGRGTEI